MAPLKTIFDLAHIYQSVFHIFDFSTKSFEVFKTDKINLFNHCVFQLLCVTYLMALKNINFLYVKSKSNLLNFGMNVFILMGVTGSIFLKNVIFWRRKNIWLILKKLNSIDLMVFMVRLFRMY